MSGHATLALHPTMPSIQLFSSCSQSERKMHSTHKYFSQQQLVSMLIRGREQPFGLQVLSPNKHGVGVGWVVCLSIPDMKSSIISQHLSVVDTGEELWSRVSLKTLGIPTAPPKRRNRDRKDQKESFLTVQTNVELII